MKQQVPFKFLDAYTKADKSVFFGREKETNDLYDALSGVKHLLVYGPSGSGKTSLIECGLRNQFSDADWFALSIRRGDNINTSLYARVNEILAEKIAIYPQSQRPEDSDIDFGELIKQLFEERFQPIYLLFDQFEELLILGSDTEKLEFFSHLNRLINYKVPCRILLIMREEFIGHLSEYEALCPSIFKHRFRLEKMRKEKVRTVINEMLETKEYQGFYALDSNRILVDTILAKLPDEKREIELTHVQVFLSELWDRAKQLTPINQLPLLHSKLVTEEDDLEGVLNSFLKKQLNELVSDYGENSALEVLATMISERNTKLQLSAEAIKKDLQTKEVQIDQKLPDLLRELEERRLIRTQNIGGQTQYEISHDLLALVVGQNLTSEMQMRKKAEDVYKVYAERKGYLNQHDLDFIRPYQQYKTYPVVLGQKIKESEVFNKEEQEKELEEARKRTRILRTLLVAALFALILAGWQYLEAVKAKESALDAKNLEELKTTEAQKNYNLAQTEKQKSINAFNDVKAQKQIVELEKFKAKKERDNTLLALSRLRETTKVNSSFLLKEAKLNISNFQYPEALQKLEAIQKLGFLDKEGIESLLEIAYFYNESYNFDKSIEALNLISNQSKTQFINKIQTDSLKQNQIQVLLYNLNPNYFSLLKEKVFPNLLRNLIAKGETEEALKKLDYFLNQYLGSNLEMYFSLLNLQWRNEINNEHRLKDIINDEYFGFTKNQINNAFLKLIDKVEFKISSASYLNKNDSNHYVRSNDYGLFSNFKKGEIELALKNMRELLINQYWDKNHYTDLVILMNQYNRLERFKIWEGLTSEDIKTIRNSIGFNALELAEEVLITVNDSKYLKRSPPPVYASIQENFIIRDSLLNLIIEDDFDTLFWMLKEKMKLLNNSHDQENNLILLQGEYMRNNRSYLLGLADFYEMDRIKCRISKSLIDLIFELEYYPNDLRK